MSMFYLQEVDTKWNATSLSSDSDDKSKEKFRKLMGIHGKTAEKIEVRAEGNNNILTLRRGEKPNKNY